MNRFTYMLLWDAFIWGGWAYLVFFRDANPWWALLAIALTVTSTTTTTTK